MGNDEMLRWLDARERAKRKATMIRDIDIVVAQMRDQGLSPFEIIAALRNAADNLARQFSGGSQARNDS